MNQLVYYHEELNEIFISGILDSHFYCLLTGIDWEKVIILGVL